MNTLSLTLPNQKVVEYDVPQHLLDYNRVKLEDVALRLTTEGIAVYNLVKNQLMEWVIYRQIKPFAACCGLNTWENLLVSSTISAGKCFNPWIEYELSNSSIPNICVLVRVCNDKGPGAYVLSAYQLFANYGQLIAQYRNYANHPNHILEIMALMPIGTAATECLRLTYP